jgi:hypothetical protein
MEDWAADGLFSAEAERLLKRRVNSEVQKRKAAESKSRHALADLNKAREELQALKKEVGDQGGYNAREKSSHHAELTRLHATCSTKEKQLAQLKSRLSATEEQTRTKVLQAQSVGFAERSELVARVNALEKEVQSNVCQLMEEKSKRYRAEQEKRAALQRVKVAKEAHTETLGQARRAEEKVTTLQSQQDTRVASRQTITRLRDQLADMKHEHEEELAAMKEEATNTLEATKVENNTAKRRLQRAQAELDALRRQLEMAQDGSAAAESERLLAEIARAKTDNTKQREHFCEVQRQLKETKQGMQVALQALEEEVKTRCEGEEQYKQATAALEAKYVVAARSIAGMNSQLAVIETELQERGISMALLLGHEEHECKAEGAKSAKSARSSSRVKSVSIQTKPRTALHLPKHTPDASKSGKSGKHSSDTHATKVGSKSAKGESSTRRGTFSHEGDTRSKSADRGVVSNSSGSDRGTSLKTTPRVVGGGGGCSSGGGGSSSSRNIIQDKTIVAHAPPQPPKATGAATKAGNTPKPMGGAKARICNNNRAEKQRGKGAAEAKEVRAKATTDAKAAAAALMMQRLANNFDSDDDDEEEAGSGSQLQHQDESAPLKVASESANRASPVTEREMNWWLSPSKTRSRPSPKTPWEPTTALSPTRFATQSPARQQPRSGAHRGSSGSAT